MTARRAVQGLAPCLFGVVEPELDEDRALRTGRGKARDVLWTAAVLLALVCASGCGVAVTGTFDGVPFTPDATIMAVADRHDLLVRGGTIAPVRKPVEAQRLHVLLTSGRVDPLDDWHHYTAEDLLEIKRELATSDSVLLKDLPLDLLTEGETLRAVIESGEASGDFDAAIGVAPPDPAVVAEQGLGSKVTITVVPRGLSVQPRGGSATLTVEVKREREAGQDGDVATGTVNLDFGTSLLPERLVEANFAVAEPVVKCAMALGAARAAQCRNEEGLPYVDETGVVAP